MNDREIIEHWALREALTLWLVAALAAGCATIAAAIAAIVLGNGWFFISAAAAAGLVTFSIWRMRRIWARLDYLEQFL